MYGGNEEANTVHHIYPADEYSQYAWCDWNLISVSQKGHNKLENRQTGELTELGKMLQERTIPGVDWRKTRRAQQIPQVKFKIFMGFPLVGVGVSKCAVSKIFKIRERRR